MTEKTIVTWGVTKLHWDEDSGGVVRARWIITAKNGSNEGHVRGQTSFDPDPDSKSFISLENLDEETVISWVKSNVINKDGLEKLAIERMEKSKFSSLTKGLPWEVS